MTSIIRVREYSKDVASSFQPCLLNNYCWRKRRWEEHDCQCRPKHWESGKYVSYII